MFIEENLFFRIVAILGICLGRLLQVKMALRHIGPGSALRHIDPGRRYFFMLISKMQSVFGGRI